MATLPLRILQQSYLRDWRTACWGLRAALPLVHVTGKSGSATVGKVHNYKATITEVVKLQYCDFYREN